MQRWQERGRVRDLRNGAWSSWVGSNPWAWLSFGIQSFMVVSEQANRQKDQVREVSRAGKAVRSSSQQPHFPTRAVSCQNHCTIELWCNNSEFVGGTGTEWDRGYFQLRMAGSVPLGKNQGYFFPKITPFPSSYAYLDPVLTDSKGSFHYISSIFAGFSHLTLFTYQRSSF